MTARVMNITQDRGWAWVVCFACFMVHVIFDGVYFSVGIVFVEFLEYFGRSKRDTAVIVSLCFGVANLCGPLFAFLSKRFGCRAVVIIGGVTSSTAYVLTILAPSVYVLYLTFGIMAGFGYGCVNLPSILAVNYHFKERRVLATSLAMCGNGFGALFFGPFTKRLIHWYTWKGAILIQAGIFLNAIACGLVYVPVQIKPELDVNSSTTKSQLDKTQNELSKVYSENPYSDENIPLAAVAKDDDPEYTLTPRFNHGKSLSPEINDKKKKNTPRSQSIRDAVGAILKDSFDVSVLKNVPYLLYLISTSLCVTVYITPYLFLPDKAAGDGINEFKAAWLISAIGISNLAGRFVAGLVSDIKWVNRVFVAIGCMFMCGLSIVLMPFWHTIEPLVICCVAFGLSLGASVTLSPVLIGDFVGKEKMAEAFGIMNFFRGVAFLSGPPIIGWLDDISQTYFTSFATAGLVIVAASFILCLVPLCVKNYRASKWK